MNEQQIMSCCYVKRDEKSGDCRTAYERDKARILHGASFRRLRGKTQVTGATEGDFHRTRLTHTIEVAQIGTGLVSILQRSPSIFTDKAAKELSKYIFNSDNYSNDFYITIESACYAHDLGHPPFGHGGERALHEKMQEYGCSFEGNAQTIRILTKLEKYEPAGYGILPTRRVLLATLKYPVCVSNFTEFIKPPKGYYEEEQDVISWALGCFSEGDRKLFQTLNNNKAVYKTFDASVMDVADEIAYSTHDLEDAVSRETVSYRDFKEIINGSPIPALLNIKDVGIEDFYYDSYIRKTHVGNMVAMMMKNIAVVENEAFEHPLLRYKLVFKEPALTLKEFSNKLLGKIIDKPEVKMLERKGQHIVKKIFQELIENPDELVHNWGKYGASKERNVCDYIASMTDEYAGKIYERMFMPGKGSSHDEL